jgi:hypothetical protein
MVRRIYWDRMCLDGTSLDETTQSTRWATDRHTRRRHSADIWPLTVGQVLFLTSAMLDGHSSGLHTASVVYACMVSSARDSVRLAMNDHDCPASGAIVSTSRCILREYSPVLKAASAASTPAGTSSAMVCDADSAAAANEPVHTPMTYEVEA